VLGSSHHRERTIKGCVKVLKRKLCEALVVELDEEPGKLELPQTKGIDNWRGMESSSVSVLAIVDLDF
jgi:hypothetical protein